MAALITSMTGEEVRDGLTSRLAAKVRDIYKQLDDGLGYRE